MAQAKLSSTDDLLSLLVTTAIGVSGRRHVRLTDERTGRLDGSVSGGGRCLLLALMGVPPCVLAACTSGLLYWVMTMTGRSSMQSDGQNVTKPRRSRQR